MIRKLLLASVALSMASTAFAQDISVLRIGLDGSENEADQVRKTACVVEGLKTATGVSEVQLFPSPNYNGVIQGLLGGTIDIAVMGASAYAAIALQNADAVDPILTTVNEDGATGYHTLLVVSADSDITDLEGLRGKKLGFADPDSASGFLVPNVSLPTDLGEPIETFFGETGFGGGHENLVLGVLDGTWDGGTTYGSGVGEWSEGYSAGNLRIMVDKGILDMDDLVEVWRSPLIPNGPLMVSNAVPANVKEEIKQYFMALPSEDLACFQGFTGGANSGFIEVDASFYETIVEARRSIIGN